MQKLNDLSRSLTALEPNGTLIAVIEMSLSSWLVAGIVPGVERQPLKKLAGDGITPSTGHQRLLQQNLPQADMHLFRVKETLLQKRARVEVRAISTTSSPCCASTLASRWAAGSTASSPRSAA